MTLAQHLIPEEVFFDLAAGRGGSDAVEHLRAGQYSKRLLLLRGVRDLAEQTAHEQAPRVRQAYQLLAEIQGDAPEATEAVLRYPTVGSWAMRTLYALNGRDTGSLPAEPGEMAAVAAAASIRSGRHETIEVPVVSHTVVLPSLGRASVPVQTGFAVVRSAAGQAEIEAAGHRVGVPADPHRDASGWDGLRRLTAEHRGVQVGFFIDDHDPHRMPGARRTERRLSAAEFAQWGTTLQQAWQVLAERHPATADEVRTTITTLTPLIAPENGTSSATSKLAFGNIGLSTPPDPHSFAVTLAHEVQHAKLSALIDLVPLTGPDDGSRFYAPWRDDPRPIGGLLQGAYAHLGIAAFWRVERAVDHPAELALRAHTEFAHWREATTTAIRVLRASSKLTPAGELFAAEMARTMAAMTAEPVPDRAQRRAQASGERHLARWRLRNGEPSPGQVPELR